MGLETKLQQKQIQKLSPQQIQLIKLLETPLELLEQRIKKELEENPVLEEGEPEENTEISPENETFEDIPEKNIDENPDYEAKKEEVDDEYFYNDDEDIPLYKLTVNNYSPQEDKQIPFVATETLYEFLKNQLYLLNLNEKEKKIAEYIIGTLDSKTGYLTRDPEYIASELLIQHNIETDEKEIEKIIRKIQTLDPPGIAARDLKESLEIQLKRKLEETPEKETLKLALLLIQNHFNEFIKKHYDKIISKLGITRDQLKAVLKEISKLNPRPANAYSPEKRNIHQIIPDFILQKIDNQLHLTLNSSNIPPIRINKTYEEMFKNSQKNKDKSTSNFLKQKLDSAKWFIDAIKQRERTLYKTMKAIIDYQREFFETGDEKKLKPMILKDIADITGLDISTISRVANSKYIQTPYGIFPLKHFFSEGMEKEDGETVSTREIKKILRELINNENKQKPLTDDKLAKLLQEKGYKIARRTVAKYREQMNIPVARLRKQI